MHLNISLNISVQNKPFAWSYSSLKLFLDCAKRYEEEKVKKSVKRTPTEQILWGEEVHKAFETSLTTKQPPTDRFKTYHPIMDRFAQTKGIFKAEQQLAINSSFKPVTYFAPDVWCRGVLDAVWIDGDVARVVDWKTGKCKKDLAQLKLFALLLFAHEKQVDRINTGFVWLQTGKMDVEKFHRKDIPILWQDILPDVRRMEYAYRTGTFVPRPSGLCNWCPVRACSFWRSEDGTGNQRGRT